MATDTLQGVPFVFGDQANYGSFINAIDRLRAAGAKTYMARDNHLWFYILPPAPVIEAEKITPLYGGTYLMEVKQYERLTLLSPIQKTWNNIWSIFLGYAILLTAAIRYRLQR